MNRLAFALRLLGHDLDRAARAFGNPNAKAPAVVEIEFEALARAELDYGVAGAYAAAVVAIEAVATARAAGRLEQRTVCAPSALHFVEEDGFLRREFLAFREGDQRTTPESTLGTWRSRRYREVPTTLRP